MGKKSVQYNTLQKNSWALFKTKIHLLSLRRDSVLLTTKFRGVLGTHLSLRETFLG